MVKISKDELDGRADSVYRLVLLAAKRARELQSEALRLGGGEPGKPTVRAMREIADGKIGYELWQEDEEEQEKKPS